MTAPGPDVKPPKVTVAVPVMNGADYLGAALESALSQTWGDLEVLVVDDGSDDDGATAAVARRFGERIRFIQQENKGVSGALNAALGAMTGDIFSWLSHDDLFEPHKTARQAEVWMRAGSRPDVAVFGDFLWIDEHGEVTGEERAPHELLKRRPAMAVYDGRVNGCTVFAPRAMLLAAGGFDEAARYAQDYRMWRRLARQGLLLHVPELVARIRRHSGQGSQKREAREEGDRFWSEALADVTEVEAAVAAGSAERFLRHAGEFLRYRSPNKRAAEEAFAQAAAASEEALVSVVIDGRAEPVAVLEAVDSVLAQTHERLEVLLVGVEPQLGAEAIERGRARGRGVVVVASEARSSAGRLRRGAALARGAYIALLEPPARFRPGKIAAQVSAMSAAGALWSHTSYAVAGEVRLSGAFNGRVYPEIVGGCPILLSTVVLHRSLVASGLLFADADAPPDLSWIEIAARHELTGLEEALVELPRPPRDAGNADAGLLRRLEEDPLHARHRVDLARRRTGLERAERELGTWRRPAIEVPRAFPAQAET